MAKLLMVVSLLSFSACSQEDAFYHDPAEVWCSRLVECASTSNPEKVMEWCKAQYIVTDKAQVSNACLDEVASESCEDFLAGIHDSCK